MVGGHLVKMVKQITGKKSIAATYEHVKCGLSVDR